LPADPVLNERAQQFKTPATNVTDFCPAEIRAFSVDQWQSDRSWSIEQPLPSITQDVSLDVPEIKEITEFQQGSLQAKTQTVCWSQPRTNQYNSLTQRHQAP
jgi:hypothetical protein